MVWCVSVGDARLAAMWRAVRPRDLVEFAAMLDPRLPFTLALAAEAVVVRHYPPEIAALRRRYDAALHADDAAGRADVLATLEDQVPSGRHLRMPLVAIDLAYRIVRGFEQARAVETDNYLRQLTASVAAQQAVDVLHSCAPGSLAHEAEEYIADAMRAVVPVPTWSDIVAALGTR